MANDLATLEADPSIEVLTIKIPLAVDQIGVATAAQVESMALEAAQAVRNACKRRGWGQ